MNTVTTVTTTSVPVETGGGHVTSSLAAPASRSSQGLIVVRDGVELPAPGRWVIPAQSLQVRTGPPWRRRRRRHVEGELLVGDDLTLRLDDVAGDFRFRGRLESADRTGRWRFRGDVTTGPNERAVETTIDVVYHGVVRSGRAVAWLVVAASGQHTPRWKASRFGAPVLSGGLNAVLDEGSDRGRRSCLVMRSVGGASRRSRPPAGRVRSNDARGTSWRRRRRRRGRRPDAGSHDRQRPGDRHDVRS